MKSRTTLLAALLLTTAVIPAAEAGWLHQENSVFQAEKASQKHPKSLEQTIVLPRDAAQAKLCVAYSRDYVSGKSSRVVTNVAIEATDGSVENVKMISRVSGEAGLKCKDQDGMEAGATVTFRHTFKKMPRVRTTDAGRQSVVVAGIVSTVGEPGIGKGALALVPEEGGAPLGLLQGEASGWFHSANSVFHADGDGDRHPQTLSRAIVMPHATGRRPLVCAAYDRSLEAGGAGRGDTRVKIARGDGTMERLRLAANVKDGSYLSCKNAERKIAAGDIVSFETTFESMPQLPARTFADLISAVSSSGQPRFPKRPKPPKPDVPEESEGAEPEGDGGVAPPPPPPPPPPGPGGGGLSVADEYATARIMAGRRQQLVKPRAGAPTKWMVFGPRTAADSNGTLIPSTVGYGGSIAGALADYERKQGSLGGTARRLSSSERSAIQYFSNMSSVGPSAIRKDANGGFHGDIYRTWLGVRQGGPFRDMVATVNWMKSLGL